MQPDPQEDDPANGKIAPKVVIFFGADGTGKTTQARLLLLEFRKRGFGVVRAWVRGRHSFAFFISQVLLKLGCSAYIPLQDAPGGKLLDTRRIHGKRLWSLIEFLSVFPLVIRRVTLPLAMGKSIVAERFVIDTLVYNEYFIGAKFRQYARILLRMVPRSSIMVHFDASKEDVILRRSGGMYFDDFMDFQLKQYRIIARKLGALTINTSLMDIETARRTIERRVFPPVEEPGIASKIAYSR